MTYSYSDILTYQRCPKKFEYAVVENLQRKRRNINLAQGIVMHELLMGHYLGTFDERFDALQEQVDSWIFDDEILDGRSLLDESAHLINRYLHHHSDDWEILHVEETFVIELDNGEQISFTPDLVIRDERGVWIVDHKSTSTLPGDEVPTGDLQSLLYSSAMREIYEDFRGFIFNYIRKKVPREPRLVKTGDKRVADLQRIDTDYETLFRFLEAEAPDLLSDPMHQRRLAELKDEDRFFWRKYVFVTDEEAMEILDDMEYLIDQIKGATRYPRHFLPYAGAKDCKNCEFRDLCVGDLKGYNRESILVQFEERDMSHRQYDHELEVLSD